MRCPGHHPSRGGRRPVPRAENRQPTSTERSTTRELEPDAGTSRAHQHPKRADFGCWEEPSSRSRAPASCEGFFNDRDLLDPHAQAGDISALQGPGPRKVHPAALRWVRWTPTTRLLAGATGLGLMALASRDRTMRGAAAGLAGFELFEQVLLHGRAGTSSGITRDSARESSEGRRLSSVPNGSRPVRL